MKNHPEESDMREQMDAKLNDEAKPTLGFLMAVTGCGPRTVRRLIRDGKLPGFIDGARYVCSPGEMQTWMDGTWKYTGVRSSEVGTKKSTKKMVHRNMRYGIDLSGDSREEDHS